MPNYDKFLTQLKLDYPEAWHRGKEFEQVCKRFLKSHPQWAKEFRSVWLWNEWPDRSVIGEMDIGIDLVAKTHSGQCYAIQAKCHRGTVPSEEINSFIALSGRKEFDCRLLICTSDITNNAKTKLRNQDKTTIYLLGSDLAAAPVDWMALLSGSGQTSVGKNAGGAHLNNCPHLGDCPIKTTNPENLRNAIDNEDISPYRSISRGNNWSYYQYTAYIHMELNEYDKAIDDYTRLIEKWEYKLAFSHLDPRTQGAANLNQWNEIPNDPKELAKWEKRFLRQIPEPELPKYPVFPYVSSSSKRRNVHDFIMEREQLSGMLSKRGIAHSLSGDGMKAIDDCTKAIELNPNYGAIVSRALVYYHLGKDKEALDDCNAALPNNSTLGFAYTLKGKLRDKELKEADRSDILLISERWNNEEQWKDGGDSHALLMAWGSGHADVDALHMVASAKDISCPLCHKDH